MVEKISLSPLQKLYAAQSRAMEAGSEDQSVSFGDLLRQTIDSLNQSQLDADTAIKSFISGETTDVHSVMIALEKADMNLRVAMQFRNKLISAYEEVMRMQV